MYEDKRVRGDTGNSLMTERQGADRRGRAASMKQSFRCSIRLLLVKIENIKGKTTKKAITVCFDFYRNISSLLLNYKYI